MCAPWLFPQNVLFKDFPKMSTKDSSGPKLWPEMASLLPQPPLSAVFTSQSSVLTEQVGLKLARWGGVWKERDRWQKYSQHCNHPSFAIFVPHIFHLAPYSFFSLEKGSMPRWGIQHFDQYSKLDCDSIAFLLTLQKICACDDLLKVKEKENQQH